MRFLIFILLFALSLNVSSQLKKEYYDAKETQLKSETDYYKGMPHGVYTEYYQSGNVLSKGYYYSGKLNQYLGKETVELLQNLGFKNIELKKDMFGNDRMVKSEK